MFGSTKDLSKRLMHEDAEEQDAAQEEIEEEEREEGTREEDEGGEEEAHTPEVKELIEHVVANIIVPIELSEQQFMRADDTGRVIGYMHTGLLERMRLLGQDPFKFVKNILKRRQSERADMRRHHAYNRVYGGYVERYKYERYAEGRQIEDREWMVKIIERYDYSSHGKVFTAPWHGENPHECNVKYLMVCCAVKSTSRPSHRDPKSLWWPSQGEKKPIEELMREGRVFRDGVMEVWVKLTESEYRDAFAGWLNEDKKKDAIKNGLLLPSTLPHRMMPLHEYLPRTVTHSAEEAHLAEEDPESAANFYVEDMGEGAAGGNRAQKKHKTNHKTNHKTKSKSKSKSKSKCKTKSKSKCKTKSKSKCKTKSKSKSRHH